MAVSSYQPPPSSLPPNDGKRFGLRFSVPQSIPHYIQPLTPVSFLLRAALIAPKRLAVVHPERGAAFTYEQWAARCLSLAYALQSVPGWKPGERVAILAPNAPMILEAHFGILAARGIDTPLNIRNNRQEIQYVLEHSGARVILADWEFAHLVPKSLPHGTTVIISQDTCAARGQADIDRDPYEQFLAKGRAIWDRLEKEEERQYGERARRGWELLNVVEDENEPCALCYTSGTTGRPKGVLTTHRGSYLAAVANSFESKLNPDSVYLWTLPLFHAIAWTYPWAVTAALATHYMLRKIDNDKIWKALNEHGVTHFCAAPTVHIGIVNHPAAKKLPRDVLVPVAASAPTANLLAKMENLNLKPVHVYGLTETYGPFTKRYSEPSWGKLSVEDRAGLMARQGHPFLVVDEVRVVKRLKEDDAGSDVRDERELIDVARDGEEIGEIIMRGNLAMLGYYNDEAATKKNIRHGWYYTGDLAVRHPGGEIAIKDRSKDIIISGGENISSLMVENELSSHDAVLECTVVARPHEKWQEIGHAFIVLRQGKKTTADELREYLRGRMSKFAVPHHFDFVDELPKTSTGKVQKK